MIKRAILYGRVSTDEQAEKGYSLPSQLSACKAYAVEQGFLIVGEFSDDYTGTVPLEQRPQGKNAFKMLKSGQADILIVYTMDRLVRPPEDGDEWDTPVLIRGLAKLGKEIHTVNRGQLKTDFASLLIAMLDAKSSGEERRKIIERTSRGRRTKAKSGKVVGAGMPPYGYIYTEGTFVINEDEAKIVRLVYSLYVEKHMTQRGIALKLSEMKVPTPWAKIGRSSANGVWAHTAVARIIDNETYVGIWRHGRYIGASGKGGRRPLEETVPVSVPAIVSVSTWKAAHEQRQQNFALAKRNRKKDYVLSGIVRCGCGYAMHAQAGAGNRWFYYRCSERSAKMIRVEERKCFEKPFDGKKLEAKVWDYVYNLLTGDFEANLRAAQERSMREHEPLLRDLEIINSFLADVEAEATKLVAMSKKATDMFLAKIEQEAHDLNHRHADLVMKKQKIEEQIKVGVLSDEQIESLLQFRDRVILGLENPTQEDKRKYYRILKTQVVIKDGLVDISCVIVSDPSGSSCRTIDTSPFRRAC